MKNFKLPAISRKKILFILILFLLAGVTIYFVHYYMQKSTVASNKVNHQKTAVVSRDSIISELSSSGTIAPKDTYSITSLIEGEVIEANFEEGDLVEQDQVLYRIDTSSMETELQAVQNSLIRAQQSVTNAEKDYQQSLTDYGSRVYHAAETGYVKTVSLKNGDKVSSGTKIADLYLDQTMTLRVPFLSVEASQMSVGNEGVVELAETGEQLPCVITSISQLEETLTGGRLVRYLTVQVSNPGGLTAQHSATVMIGSFFSSQEANFEPLVETTLIADLDGSVKVEEMYVSDGDFITSGTAIFRMNADDADKILRSYKDSKDKADESLENAQNKLDTTNDNYQNYTITAPISGQVIKKNTKTGDNISKSSNGSTTLATIYDLSQMTFQMSIDELDIRSVKVGQSVEITADAIKEQTFQGKVTNISLESANSNGVTNYPVTVTIDEAGELLPGMNVDGRIILEQSDDTLLIPVDALMRGNHVYLKDPSVLVPDGNVPAGYRSVEVTTGLVNESFVEILSGVSEGDEVYIAETTKTSTNQTMTPGGIPGMGGNQGGGNQGGGNQGGGRSQGSGGGMRNP